MSDIVVRLYQNSQGEVPYIKWITALKDRETKIRIQQRIRRLELGNFGNCKALKGGVNELKLDFGPGYRIYYALEEQTMVILLCGGTKPTQAEDIKKAKLYWKSYKEMRS